MMKNIKKTFAIVLASTMMFGSVASVYADETTNAAVTESTELTESADTAQEDADAVASEDTAGNADEETTEAEDAFVVGANSTVEMNSITKNQSVSLNTDTFYRIFHLDAGRKYFSVSQIEGIIDLLAQNHYTHMELTLGNDALRFILDDMSVSANGTTYSDDDITNGIIAGNKTYYNDPNGNYLTQAEMDTILAYANGKGIQIIPLINTPGHMDSIVDAMEAVGISNPAYNNSARTVDVTNAEAVNFTLALTNKYIQYFAGKGVKIFNMGADEYANDVYGSGSMGFGNLISTGKYGSFITYVNNMAAQIQNAGMVAMAFNDGFYFQNNKNYGTIDSNIAVAYWTSGWGGYSVRSAANLASDGFKIINTNDAWYYVVGRSSGTYGLSGAKTGVANTAVTSVSGSSSVTPAGSMACVWCDTPSANYNASEVAELISTLAKSNPAYFKADETDAVYEMTADSGATINTSATQTNLTSVTADAVSVEGIDTAYVAYNVLINDGTYTGSAVVTFLLTDELKAAAKLTGFVVETNGTLTKVAGTKSEDGNTYSFTAPHFSTVGVMAENDASDGSYTNEVNVTLTVDQTSEAYTEASGEYSEGTGLDTNIATAAITPVAGSDDVTKTQVSAITSGQKYLLVNTQANKTLTNSASSYYDYLYLDGTVDDSDGSGSEVWTITATNGGYYVTDENGRYLNIGNGSASVSTTPQVLNLTYTSNGWEIATLSNGSSYSKVSVSYSWWGYSYYTDGNYYVDVNGTKHVVTAISCDHPWFSDSYTWTIYYSGGSTRQTTSNATLYTATASSATYYLNNYSGSYASGYTVGASDRGSRWSIYSITSTPKAGTTNVQFTGVTPGTTSVIIGQTKYNVTVTKATKAVSLLVDSTSSSYTDTTASTAKITSGSDYVTVNTSGNTISFTGKAIGTAIVETTNCTYTITVTDEDVSNVSPLTVYLWITNEEVTANGSQTASISASAAHRADGVQIASLLPKTGTHGSNTVDYWHTMYHTSSQRQTHLGTDYSETGTVITYIRYYQGAWAYSTDRENWSTITTSEYYRPYIEAYYLQKTDVTDEVYTEVKDWGQVPHTGYDSSNFVLVDYSVKYESGDESPSSFPVSGKTVAFHCDPKATSTVSSRNGTYYRKIGMIRGVKTTDYEIYMITVTASSDSAASTVASNAKYASSYSYRGTEYVAWADSQDTIDNSGLSTYSSIAGSYSYSIGGDPHVSGLEIYNRHAAKVTFYVRAKVTEDDLNVHYVDENSGTEFHSYGIKVDSGTTFNSNIALRDQSVVNGDVVNSLGKTQTVSSDLKTMPSIPAAYRYSKYTVTRLVRSDDGKTVTLYYTFKNTHDFVIDFGLPLTITTSDLGIEGGDWTSASVTGAQYGTATVTVGGGLTYTPTTILKGIETLTLTLSDSEGTATHIIHIYPATTVYYEEGFADVVQGFDGGTKPADKQTTSALGSDANVYGYDPAYAANGSVSKSAANSTASGDKESFTFTGTGFDLYTNNDKNSGVIFVGVKNSAGKTVKIANIDTASINGSSVYSVYPDGTLYNIPTFTLTDLSYGQYTVTVTHVANAQQVSIDGFRVYNTLKDSSVYKADLEDNPTFIEVRDLELGTIDLKKVSEKYASEAYKQVYEQIADAQNCEAVLTGNSELTGSTLTDYVDNGPKNEIYLSKGMSLTLNIDTNREVQLGLRGLQNNTTASISKNGGAAADLALSTTDLFYTISDKGSTGAVTITNNTSEIIAITKLKVSDDPSPLGAITEETVMDSLYANGYENDSVPEVTYADASLTVSLKDYAGNALASTVLTANGVQGETAAFAADAIQEAAQEVLPSGYEFAGKFEDAAVVYGENGSVDVQIGKVATLKINYKKGRKVVGTATLTRVQTSKSGSTTFSTSEIKSAAPNGYSAISLFGTKVNYGSSKTITATCW